MIGCLIKPLYLDSMSNKAIDSVHEIINDCCPMLSVVFLTNKRLATKAIDSVH